MKVIPNPRMAEELAHQAQFDSMMQGRAEAAKEHAEAIAPRGRTGEYARSFVVEKVGKTWRLGNTDFAAHWVEWGSINNPAYAPIRRAVQATGLHLREAPKN